MNVLPPVRVRHEYTQTLRAASEVVPDLAATKVEIELRSQGADGCEAEVAYTYTALSEAGRRFVEGFDEAAWERFMRVWEDELDHYLEAGGPLDTTGPRYE